MSTCNTSCLDCLIFLRNALQNKECAGQIKIVQCDFYFMFIGVVVSCHISYSIDIYLYASFRGLPWLGKSKAKFSAIVYL